MQRSVFPCVLIAAFFLGGLCADRPTARTWAQDEAPESAEDEKRPKRGKSNRARNKPGGDKPPLIWERLNSNAAGGGVALRCSRSKVPGGWLVLVERVQRPNRRRGKKSTEGEAPARAAPVVQPTLTFMPDPGHGWDGGSPQ